MLWFSTSSTPSDEQLDKSSKSNMSSSSSSPDANLKLDNDSDLDYSPDLIDLQIEYSIKRSSEAKMSTPTRKKVARSANSPSPSTTSVSTPGSEERRRRLSSVSETAAAANEAFHSKQGRRYRKNFFGILTVVLVLFYVYVVVVQPFLLRRQQAARELLLQSDEQRQEEEEDTAALRTTTVGKFQNKITATKLWKSNPVVIAPRKINYNSPTGILTHNPMSAFLRLIFKPFQIFLKTFTKKRDALKPTPKEEKEEIKTVESKKHYPVIDLEKEFPLAYSTPPKISAAQYQLLHDFSNRVRANVTNLHDRAANVPWGGDCGSFGRHGHVARWWNPVVAGDKQKTDRPSSLDSIDGGYLLYNYFLIMKNYMKNHDGDPLEKHVHFPFRLCGKEHPTGCSAETAVAHSLKWRETYQPWRTPPSLLTENSNGWVYTRGFGRVPENCHDCYRHAIIWVRVGNHRVLDPSSYIRAVLHAVDKAVAETAVQRSGSSVPIAKFNVVVDGLGYEWSKVPGTQHIRQFVTMLQDHYPNRLGMIFLVNLSRTAEILISLFKQLITKDVREKISILSHDPNRRMAQLEALVEPQYIPSWLGGPDSYRVDVSQYYPEKFHWTEEEARAYLTEMPYHDH